ncbi:MAG TPA: bifunctional DNA-formamidopyrimidine glycosylase/DNA-(apurinic or apyrimidinic site) lyase [Candidatus Cloacimonetes bacterium]|nr:bifunctional DNA-formamidopyrimidine glycosylase/DNA-(apurinic or apyrimidinic site) lyase [Candidatus Cloacimonadota bacterium]
MPELPEVQTIVAGLKKKILNKKIVSLFEERKGTIRNFIRVPTCEFGSISAISRRGKYIIFHTSNGYKFVIHLRMTGKMIFEKNLDKKSTHERAYFIFDDKTKLIFDDVRAFGKIQIYDIKNRIESLEKLGLEPLSDDFTAEYLRKRFRNRRSSIKNLLLNQSIVAGLGNIYVCEILYRAKISPQKKGNELSIRKLNLIVKETKKVLKEAIKYNGTTISDYRSVEDKTGEFQKFLNVYQKKECPQGHQIKRIKQVGRSTYYCPVCQKKK